MMRRPPSGSSSRGRGKRLLPTEHSHLDGRAPHQDVVHSDGHAPHQDVIVIQECKDESFKGKSLWDPNFNIPTYGETTFLPSEDKDRLIAHDEDHLLRDAMKQFGQAFAMGCLVVSKKRDRRATLD